MSGLQDNKCNDAALRISSSQDHRSTSNAFPMKEKRGRKRQRPSLFFSLSVIPSPSSSLNARLIKESSPKNGNPDRPDWSHLGHLFAALLLASVLGVFSAMDAKIQCLKHETYSYMELMDDDSYNRYEQASEFAALQQHLCVKLFFGVVVPAGVTTFVLSFFALVILYCQAKQQWKWTFVAKDDFPKILRNLVVLFWMLVVVAIMQTYNVAWIMLIPKNMSKEDNPYQSLAAVDQYGNVGDNANL